MAQVNLGDGAYLLITKQGTQFNISLTNGGTKSSVVVDKRTAQTVANAITAAVGSETPPKETKTKAKPKTEE